MQREHAAPAHATATPALNDAALDRIFREARTYNGWLDRPVTDEQLREMHALATMGPTSFNGCPMRVVFVRSPEAKERLAPALMKSNVDKTLSAPVTAIVAHDLRFWEWLPWLNPHKDVSGLFRDSPAFAETTAFRNGSLQGAYLIIAARALGLDCGPMSGFDPAMVDEAFFAGTSIRTNFLCNIGYGDPDTVYSRNPRPAFDEACRIE
ncbi:malonic semialdehyde reductase [Arhodomonas aquaeolei]|uniref:malonic semialdehyde reductase n=1 Tax=Arhodomonas aquaeolei TaxID=2369 RepID=UPI00037D26BD|nr:malonic semialdehyde reductase [Arhodomonas aquaeolei]MCS4502971.1 malonic semialdehyde reductase [Arhodomonas aquaeolei]